MMACENQEKQRGRWRPWVGPVLVSILVFGLLAGASAISTNLAVALGGVIVVGGIVALRLF